MTPIGTLWGDVRQRQTKVILSVAALNRLELDLPSISLSAKPTEFTDKFPYEKIPAFEGKDGFKLTEGTAIARYISSIGTEVDLLGSNKQETAVIDQWVHYAEHEILAPTQNILGLIYSYYTPFSLETVEKNTERLVRALKYLESYLAAHPSGYVALDTVTLADFVLASAIHGAAGVCLGTAERALYPHIFAHYAKVTEDVRVKQYWGTDGFVDVRIIEPRPVPAH